MRHPDDIDNDLRERFDRDFPDWARGKGTWPLKFTLKPPTADQRAEDPVACHAWADKWSHYNGPGTVRYANARFPTGIHRMPQSVIFTSPGAAAAALADTRETWRRCGIRLTELAHAFPGARFDRIVRRITELPDQDYRCIVSTARWVIDNPTSGMLLRQLPIEGINTKWLARHATLLLSLLGDEQSSENIANEPSEELDTDEGSVSLRGQLHRRLGLRIPPYLIQVAVLDPELRLQLAGMRHLAAGVEDLSRWPRTPDTVVILENKETGYAITDDHPGTVVLHGAGFGVAHYARIKWVRAARKVIYWGDIDLPGLAFLSDLRGNGVAANSVHMDLETLKLFRHLTVEGAPANRINVPHLTEPERRLYDHLLDYSTTHDTGLLLEQERITWDHAYPVLVDAMSS
ncbi:Wadjet anti-phage system protein JetD domain-containing protein [Nocardia testacea]|uniref:Wadjet anti-phage system protein JetD domain-containing protein n=1 Tax=Nocardia testacea TaxID=248551 RepID=UPI003C2FDB01